MKTETIYIRIIAFPLVLLTTLNVPVNSQENSAKKGKMYLGVVITPQQTTISNKDFSASSVLSNKKNTAINYALEGGYFFSKIAGISIGAEMRSYSTELSIDTCSFKFQDTDSDNESYEMRVKGKLITETQKISFLSIPVCLVLRFPTGEKFGFYVKGGISFDIPLVKTYKGSGTFSYSGYYSEYPVLFHDVPDHFPSNVGTSSSGDLDLKPFSQTLMASGGISLKISKSIQIALGVNFNKSLGNISAHNNDSDYKFSSKVNEMNSIMGGTSKADVQGLGVSLGFRYYIR